MRNGDHQIWAKILAVINLQLNEHQEKDVCWEVF